ncbi:MULTISPECIES: glycosyltransferase family A protein [unclassified Pseudodesulfovibrio]|uniref:glycosyltransferase family 2 protein n=1 Tax=unclassified Pseudodesulfovibrio TaxID=2661612 RepID=UPI0013E38567|nr:MULTISPECIES: glycosyltransferase family A protein [unclassified Pseudodesulfovibrio]MCJ2163272.1 glycosyltransferase [Pseudodesulfovibrio sp. S3-i]
MSLFFEANTDARALVPMVGQAYQFQGVLSNWDWLEEYLKKIVAPLDPEIAQLLMGDVYLAGGRYASAVSVLEELVRLYGIRGWGLRLAAAHALAGETTRSLELLKAILTDFPMHTSALLYMDSLAFPVQRSARLQGKCVVSIYSYNKAEELARTLDSVLASDLGSGVGDISVRVLINGSGDDSLAVAERAQARFGGVMDVVALPVNVGAPAARNWLLDSAVRDGARWIVYLDDDVLVPSDWLYGFAAGVESFPDAGVWGCRVGDASSQSLTQHGDGFLLGREDAARTQQSLVLQEPCVECLMPSLLSYRRYAASVTGCCHLFEVESLVQSKGFDILFSPSQFDDLDLDLRRLVQGKPAAYLGDVHIVHLRESSHFQQLSDGAVMRSEAHRHILEERHVSRLDALLNVQSALVEADLDVRRARLREAGLLPVGP